ncbi:hypothetical protein QY702_04805 [Xanthomonas campestris pv. plantaginis]|uniref:hypothetical protein n=1 Tax=Xanthomonas campestris TaxID=339 RepID=UPI002B22A235|nr:hypothetical protein [Xanthomonas campestris]MEA9605788.1 hypothetical protein [Xanthomonas campestris pv. plantaginis]
MPNFSLSKQFSLSDIESALHQVLASPGSDLLAGKEFASKRHGPLRDAARLQLLATWARHAPGRRLIFNAQNLTQVLLDKWCDYAPGLVAIRMSGGVVIGNEQISRRDALRQASSKIASTELLEFDDVVKGRSLDFPCIAGAKSQYLSALFTEKSPFAVKGKQEMLATLEQLNSYVARTDATRIEASFWDACALFATELMKNTQEHATSDAEGKPYAAHAEGLIIGWKEMSDRIFGVDFQSHASLREFWEREQVSFGQGDTGLRSIQMSFFDTGPGFVGRLAGKRVKVLDIEEEREIVLKGLRKHATSKRETGAGNGIPEVLEKLRQVGGLITIRTGRLRLFRAFAPGEDVELFAFEDWSPDELGEMAGSVVSILLPIRRP